jgi:hypothetical protein
MGAPLSETAAGGFRSAQRQPLLLRGANLIEKVTFLVLVTHRTLSSLLLGEYTLNVSHHCGTAFATGSSSAAAEPSAIARNSAARWHRSVARRH